MSPRFYGYLWILFAVSAGLFLLFGALSMVVVVVYGFIAFGLIFAGMMCVLPGIVAHPTEKTNTLPAAAKKEKRSFRKELEPSPAGVHFPLNPKFNKG